jgi:hypothetical protein
MLNIKSDTKKVNIKDKKRYKKNNKNNVIVFVILFLLIYLIYINRTVNITDETNFYNVNLDRQYNEILEKYNKEESKLIFIEEINKVQSLVGKYLVNNTNFENNNFGELIKYVNREINKDNFGNLKGEKSIFFVGDYKVDDNGKVKFKFKSKKIEPIWINEFEYIERN